MTDDYATMTDAQLLGEWLSLDERDVWLIRPRPTSKAAQMRPELERRGLVEQATAKLREANRAFNGRVF